MYSLIKIYFIKHKLKIKTFLFSFCEISICGLGITSVGFLREYILKCNLTVN